MIISASRRTDIPALYPEWLLHRLEEGKVLIPNPYNRKKITKIEISPETVDCIVFWSKNPKPLQPYLKEIDAMGYKYFFQMTVTGYGKDVEAGLPPTEKNIATFLLLSEQIGKDRIDWRYDPIFLNEKYTASYHLEKFEQMCEWMHAATERCTISFLDSYRNCPFAEMESEDIRNLAEGLSKIAQKYELPLYTCAEKLSLDEYGICRGACIDRERLHHLTGYKLDLSKDPGQRKECLCAESIDIGMYDTCTNGCAYCYAVKSPENAKKKRQMHDPQSPMLTGQLVGDEQIVEREIRSSKDNQLSLFDLPQMYGGF